ncbi:group 3 secretory phospholipase A2 [Gambusia affinis]|uniref:group 3 secretory phospholipase A2 n=1 Tax=Gambusia affinis TaxID=33528 RepID=UPI001CDBB921|nr:group 3 secretory phospholipase A2 [Gambusia affinis]
MTHIPALLALTVTSALLGCAAARASIDCSWTKVSSNGQLHVSFLRGDPQGSAAAPRLYHGVWSGERALLGCTWSDDAALIQSYLSACRGRTREFKDRAGKTLDLESLFDADRCVSLASPSFANLPEHTAGRHVRSLGDQGEGERSEVRIHARVKRGFIVPGTLWCGSGNKAPSYADLGVFSDTDSCCREHDQCKHTILSFQSDFGVFNSNIFTMSHCDCDNKFRRCLTEANDSIADVVGYTFFNLLKMHCFTFSHRPQCAERNWFGMCKKTQMAVYADVHSPTLYESSESKEGCVNSSCSDVNSTSPARLHETNTSRPHLLSSTAATDTVPAASATPSVTAATDATNSTDAEASASTVRREDLGNVLPSTSLQRSAVTAEDRSCAPYKELDECKNKILPRQRKYGLHNTETGTLFHCNCTARLFHALTQQRQLSKVETLLIGHVSQSCFLPQDCTSSSNCTATVVKAELPRLDPTSVEVAERRHLQAKRRKGRRPGETKAKRKDRAVRLYKLCVRMTRPKQTKKNKKQVQSTEPPRITGTQVN